MARALGSNQSINLTEYIRDAFGLTDDSIKYTIAELSKFIEKDKTLINAVRGLLLQRLKYATGSLYNNIGFKLTPNISKSKAGNIQDVILVFSLILNTDDKGSKFIYGKRQALLGSKEIQSEVPSVDELVKWIRGKQRYFTEQLSLLDRKRNSERAALRVQRAFALAGNKKVSKTITYPNSITELATLIRSRMRRRKSKTGSASKGSQFAFLGYYSSTMSADRNKKKSFMTPKYKEFTTPLLTENGQTGEIQILVNELVKNYMKSIMSYKPSSRNYGKISLSGELDKFAKDRLFPSTVLDEIYRGIKFLDNQLNILYAFSKERKNSSKYKQAIKQVQLGITTLSARQSKIMLGMHETKSKEFRQQTINFANMVQQYSFNFRKRHAIRKRGR